MNKSYILFPLPRVIFLINKSAKFFSKLSFATLIIPTTTTWQHYWYEISCCFFINKESSLLIFFVTVNISKTYYFHTKTPQVEPYWFYYLKSSTSGIKLRSNIKLWTAFCLLIINTIFDWFKNTRIPVCECLINLSPV